MIHRHKDKKKIILSLPTPRRHIWGVEVHLHSFLNSAQVEDEWSVSSPSRFFPLKVKPGTNRTGDLVEPKTGLGTFEKSLLSVHRFELRIIQPVP